MGGDQSVQEAGMLGLLVDRQASDPVELLPVDAPDPAEQVPAPGGQLDELLALVGRGS
jgi:hypothetical protein